MTLLIVDDEPDVLRFLADAVESKGYEVLRANSGEEALTICESRESCFDLIISDVAMPRMNGRALAECVNRRYPGVPVIFISGYPESRQLLEGLTARGFAQGYTFLEKPIRAETLLKVINTVLSRAHGRTCFSVSGID
jgi:two-component system cell cycle sensor histidine kinase/response regulator CckA